MQQVIDDLVYGPAVGGLGLALIVFQLVVLVMAVRRRRRGTALPLAVHAIAGAIIAALPVLVGFSVHAARALMFGVVSGTGADPSEKAIMMSRSMSGQISAIPFAVSVTGLAAVLWFVGLAYTMSAPRSDGRARGFPPAALVGVGLLPIAFGALQWSTGLIKSFASMAGLRPDDKPAILDRALEAGHADLAQYARISMIAIPILAVIAVVLIVMRGRDRATAAPPPARPPSPRLPLAVSAAAVVLAALLFVAARPMAAENALPWPPTQGSQLVFPGGPPTPDLVGPDAVERAPVIAVHRDGLGLDGTTGEDFDSLESKLMTLRNNFKLLHPSEDFNDMALILADPAISIARLTSVLRAVRSAWYYRPLFAFAKTETQVRPVLGKLDRITVTGARIKLAFTDDEQEDEDDPGEWKNAVPLRLQAFADYGAVARQLVELRRAGKPVIVKIDRAAR